MTIAVAVNETFRISLALAVQGEVEMLAVSGVILLVVVVVVVVVVVCRILLGVAARFCSAVEKHTVPKSTEPAHQNQDTT